MFLSQNSLISLDQILAHILKLGIFMLSQVKYLRFVFAF